ncbi:MAG TPA: ADP-glyceromanno-heptose 6-epimerase [Acetobacteraceae bacterium]|nr:ADP-glyceromanno-heptose 6-epimerase [Acetobacteraceae bacterium]
MIIVTGGAGFIGSNLVAALEAAGESEIVVCDRLRDGPKWRNISKRMIADIVMPEDLAEYITAHDGQISTIFHMGAISSTTATDGDLVFRNNVAFSVDLWKGCARHGIPLIYASSAATYGNGDEGFDDENTLAHMRTLKPLNLYGWSKWLFDCWVLRAVEHGDPAPPVWAGLRFFNVYGPNEYHKGAMQSLVSKIISTHRPGEPVTLFKSHREGIAHGEQMRDFIWVDDVAAVMMWLHRSAATAGILNLGTGTARSFADLAAAAIRATGEEPKIEYADMPESIRSAYQYYTCARMDRLRQLGYNKDFTPLEDGVTRYVRDFLTSSDPYR